MTFVKTKEVNSRPDKTSVFYDPKRASLAAFFHFLTALMLYGYLIPISLYVSIEIVKVLQSIFINQDREMYYEETDKPAHARTSNLKRNLGRLTSLHLTKQVSLTCNPWSLLNVNKRKCSVIVVTEVERALAKRKRDGAQEVGDTSNDMEESSDPAVNLEKSTKDSMKDE
ncbi:putative phospholipid-transporting ATPase 8 [Datura stramonium]|uniref:Phospholipid-transporting ATPase 8 n=1 Tax=Datura stramonium TaxID=4076 RepID=A0ABS8UIV0_DATST|nr:putative phospholipid-transporting ATPase 8 [Datura stramonium]